MPVANTPLSPSVYYTWLLIVIYNAWVREQDSSPRTRRNMHNLETHPAEADASPSNQEICFCWSRQATGYPAAPRSHVGGFCRHTWASERSHWRLSSECSIRRGSPLWLRTPWSTGAPPWWSQWVGHCLYVHRQWYSDCSRVTLP